MNDEYIERLGRYFVHMQIHERYSITFERFVTLVLDGRWGEYVA